MLAASRREAQASETETRSGATVAAVFAARPARRLVETGLVSIGVETGLVEATGGMRYHILIDKKHP